MADKLGKALSKVPSASTWPKSTLNWPRSLSNALQYPLDRGGCNLPQSAREWWVQRPFPDASRGPYWRDGESPRTAQQAAQEGQGPCAPNPRQGRAGGFA